jgi:hypothetical protein
MMSLRPYRGDDENAVAQAQMPAGFSLHTLATNVASRAFYRRRGLIEGATRTNHYNGMETIEYRWAPR